MIHCTVSTIFLSGPYFKRFESEAEQQGEKGELCWCPAGRLRCRSGGRLGGGRAGAGAAPVLRLAGAGLYGKTRMRAGIFST